MQDKINLKFEVKEERKKKLRKKKVKEIEEKR
jgi:hypothetical protein